jgi:hypothetical protein
MKYMLTTINTLEATVGVIVAKLTRLTHKIAIQLHLVVESCTICSSHARWPVWTLLDTPSYSQADPATVSTKTETPERIQPKSHTFTTNCLIKEMCSIVL